MEYDTREEHDCFAALGKLIVRFSSIDSSFSSVSDRLIETIDKIYQPSTVPDDLRGRAKFTKNKLNRLEKAINIIDTENVFQSDYSRWRNDIKCIQTVRDDACHGHCELALGAQDPALSIVVERKDVGPAHYHMKATEIEIMSARILSCSTWLYLLNSHATQRYLEKDVRLQYMPYLSQSITDLLPHRPWDRVQPKAKAIRLG